MHEYAKKQKFLEINPRSPLIEGLLRRVKALPTEEEERDLESEDELREVTSVLIDGALVRSGFGVPDSNSFFSRVDRILRRSLGVSETAKADDTVKPAPPQSEIPIDQETFGFEDSHIQLDPEMFAGFDADAPPSDAGEESPIKFEVEEIDEDGNPVESSIPVAHDEL